MKTSICTVIHFGSCILQKYRNCKSKHFICKSSENWTHLGTCAWGESAFEAPRLHLQRLGKSGRIHFLSAAAFFVFSWMALFASSVSTTAGSLSTPFSGNEPSRSLASPLVWLCTLAAWGQTGPLTGVSLDKGTDGMAYPEKKQQKTERRVCHNLFFPYR